MILLILPPTLSKIIISYLTPLPKLPFRDKLLRKTYYLTDDLNKYWYNVNGYKNINNTHYYPNKYRIGRVGIYDANWVVSGHPKTSLYP